VIRAGREEAARLRADPCLRRRLVAEAMVRGDIPWTATEETAAAWLEAAASREEDRPVEEWR
jgi:hypothetical protein